MSATTPAAGRTGAHATVKGDGSRLIHAKSQVKIEGAG
jgi:hypothetical protein